MKLHVYNKTLDPNIWNEDKTLKPDIRDSLLKVAEDFYQSTDLKSEIHNILFLGSSANYNYTPTSDIDLHIVIDITQERITLEYARKFMDGLAYKWNTEHDIEVKGHSVEVYLQDISEPNSTPQLAREGAAIYSLLDNRWLLKPNPQKIKLDGDKIRRKYQQLKKRIQELIDTENIDSLKKLMKSIRNYRDAGLLKGGEFSTENLVFKALRVSGNLKRLKDTINTIYDRKVSLPEGGNIVSDKKTPSNNLNENKNLNEGFLLIGMVFNDLTVVSEVDWKGYTRKWTQNKRHTELNMRGGEKWRYKSKTDTLYWTDTNISEKMKDAVLDHLSRKYNINDPHQSFGLKNYIDQSHYVNEIIDKTKPFLIVGKINDDLEIISKVDYIGSKDGVGDCGVTHTNLSHMPGYLGWRYKSKTNTVYIYKDKEDIPEKQIDAISEHLNSRYNITNPKFSFRTGYFDQGHYVNEIIDKTKPFLIVGKVWDDLNVMSGIDYKGCGEVSHGSLGFRGGGISWRYKSKDNTIYWHIGGADVYPSEPETDSVLDHLKKKYGIENPKQNTDSISYFFNGHKIDEIIDKTKPFLIVGSIDDDLETDSFIDYKGDQNHAGNLDLSGGKKRWRYKSKTNKVYWLDIEEPNELQKDEVSYYLKKKYDISNVTHMVSYDSDWDDSNQYYVDAHKIDEIINKTKPFFIIGKVDCDLEVDSIVDHFGASSKYNWWDSVLNHSHLKRLNHPQIRWRYKSKNNTLYWNVESDITEKQKDVVLNHLNKKYDIINPRQLFGKEMGDEWNTQAHQVDEIIDKNCSFFLGLINRENLKVVGTSLSGDKENLTHGSYVTCYLPHHWKELYNNDEAISWRYRKDLGTVYWWVGQPHPTDDEKKEVENWILKNIGNNKQSITHRFMGNADNELAKQRIDAHPYITETQELNELLAIVNANLNNNFILF